VPPSAIALGNDNKAVADIVSGQRALFDARRASRSLEIDLLREQQTKLKVEIEGLKKQHASKVRQIALFEDELRDLRSLLAKGLTTKGRLLALERDAESSHGTLASIAASISAAETKQNEIELTILRIDRTFREKVVEELRTVEAELNSSTDKLVGATDQTKRTEIRAPRGGRVFNLVVHTVGGVIKAGETIMEIVPDDDILVIGVRVAPSDVDKVVPLAPATVRLSAFNQRTTPELAGSVQRVSADLVSDAATGQSHYLAVVEIGAAEVDRLQGLALMPGMPAEVFIQTGARSPLAYLLKPLTDSLARAFREE
jgi:HlyD family secretion protein